MMYLAYFLRHELRFVFPLAFILLAEDILKISRLVNECMLIMPSRQ